MAALVAAIHVLLRGVKDVYARHKAGHDETGAALRAYQFPFRSWTSGKNMSFQLFGASLIEPTLCMNVANFIAFSGAMVQRTCGPETTAVTLSSGSFDFTSSIQ